MKDVNFPDFTPDCEAPQAREKAACERREVAEGAVRNPRQVSERLKGLVRKSHRYLHLPYLEAKR